MINSILHFNEFGVKKLEKTMINFSEDMTKIAEMVYGVTESVVYTKYMLHFFSVFDFS